MYNSLQRSGDFVGKSVKAKHILHIINVRIEEPYTTNSECCGFIVFKVFSFHTANFQMEEVQRSALAADQRGQRGQAGPEGHHGSADLQQVRRPASQLRVPDRAA